MTQPRVRQSAPLPVATESYDPFNEQVARRTVEQNFEDAYAMVEQVRSLEDREAFLAACEVSFLFGGG